MPPEVPDKGHDFGLPPALFTELTDAIRSLDTAVAGFSAKLKAGQSTKTDGAKDAQTNNLAQMVVHDSVRLELLIGSLKDKLRLK